LSSTLKSTTQHLLVAVYVLICLFGFGCNAPRDSQYDPASPSYNAPQAPDAISDLTLVSFTGLNCQISWTAPEGAFQYVLYYGPKDWDGVKLEIATRYTGNLPGVKPPGETQSIWINQNFPDTLNWSMYSYSEEELLSPGSNALLIETPSVDSPAEISGTLKSKRYDRWGILLDLITLEVEAEVFDEDGIDSVWVQYESTNIGLLALQEDGYHYFAEFPSNDSLPGRNVEAIVGHPFTIWSRDVRGGVSVSEELKLIRVLTYCPQTYELPADTLDGDPTFTWEIYDSRYSYTYTIQVIHITDPETYNSRVVFADSLLNIETVSYTIHRVGSNNPLPEDPKYLLWSVSVVDDFGNTARSVEGKFNLKPYVEE